MTWRATGTRICAFTVSASTTDRKNAEPESRMDNPVRTIEEENTGRNDTRMKMPKWYSRTRTDLTHLSPQELRHTAAREQISADPDPTQSMLGIINNM